jgi:dolichyl-phosphate beta-glucosyltransferase
MNTCIIVVPCFNESARLRTGEFLEFVRGAPQVRFLLVDDGSTDDTLDVVRGLANRDPRHFEVFSLPRNVGKAEAVRLGVLRALERRPEIVGFWDADLATPLRSVSHFRAVLAERTDLLMVIGSRVRLLGRAIDRRGLRHLLGRLFAIAASNVLGVAVYDTQCGAKLFRAGPATAALFDRSFCARWVFDVELLARLTRQPAGALAAKDLIYEVPLAEWRDVPGSKLRPRDFARAVLDLARIWWRYGRPGARAFVAPATLPIPATASATVHALPTKVAA